MTALITGITGQDGAYLSARLLEQGYKVVGVVRRLEGANTGGLSYLKVLEHLQLVESDLSDMAQIIGMLQKFRPKVVYNLAAQSSVAQSFAHPNNTLHFNIISVLNFLESIRLVDPSIRFYQASSSEMYGRVVNLPVTEQSVMHPLSPYAISKSSAHWITVNYREAYNLFACCGVLFNHDSYLRSPHFFTKKVLQSAIRISRKEQDILQVGNIEVRRDFGYAPKYVEAMQLIMDHTNPDDYLICSGKSVLLKDIIQHVFNRLNISMDKMVVSEHLYRPTDIEDMYGVPYKAKIELGWSYNLSFFDVLDALLEEEMRNHKKDV